MTTESKYFSTKNGEMGKIKFEIVESVEKSILEEAQALVGGDRGNNYGHPIIDFSRSAKIWASILDTEVSPQQVGLCMIGVKLSRECNEHKRDNLIDIAGYALTVQMIEDYNDKSKK